MRTRPAPSICAPIVAPSGDAREVVVAQSQHDETEGQFSPDGRRVTYVSNESGRDEVLLIVLFVASLVAAEIGTRLRRRHAIGR